MEIEREIFNKVFENMINYYTENYSSCNSIEFSINKIIENAIKKYDDKINSKIENICKMNKIENINILLLGNTGVGKSTLINCILELKNNKAEEGHTVKPMNLESWKKYPYNSEDTDIKGIQLWDSKGIESDDIEQNNENVKKIIEENKNYLDK